MKILLACLSFERLTGSELYVFELAKNLSKQGHKITIASYRVGDPLVSLVKEYGVECCNINFIPNESYDLIHCQHEPVTQLLIEKFPNTPKICSIHSEVISLENPVIHPSIKKYIAIRDSIKDYLINTYHIDSSMIDVIYNPIDRTKFYPKETKDHNAVLFVGTIDYLRKKTIYDLIETTVKSGRNLWIIGDNSSNYLNDILKYDHVFHRDAVIDIAKYTQSCNETAGVMLGRTTIEGWMCNKPGWIYEIDAAGEIIDKKFHSPPADLERFYSENVTAEILVQYNKILNY
jgi:glycosyltransferase involved in cell wall biosynthesis